MTKTHDVKEPLLHLVKRAELKSWKAWLIRAAAIIGSIIFICLLTAAVFKRSPFEVIDYMFQGAFGKGNERKTNTNVFFRDVAILLIISLAVTPAFQMKFWNIGAEGQVLISAFMAFVVMYYLGGKIPNGAVIFISLVASLSAGIIWAVIPALLKAKWNTNETLFTLMMNYIALQIVLFTIKIWRPTGSGSLDPIPYGNLPQIGGGDYLTSIIVAIIITVFLFVYMRFTKHGYEVSVVGESRNTAKYIGINVSKVIVRTLVLSGAMCAVAGFLLANGISHTISESTVNGRGFTAVLVSWLSQFNPIVMALMSGIVVFLTNGTTRVIESFGVANKFFASVCTGIAFLIIIACEFFIRYQIVFRKRSENIDSPEENVPPETEQGEIPPKEMIDVSDPITQTNDENYANNLVEEVK